MFERLKAWAKGLRREVLALYLAGRDPRVPWYAKALAAAAAAYALSPIDLIPDFIPVLGHVDDVILVPLAVALAVRLIPADVMGELRIEAARRLAGPRPSSRVAAGVIVGLWVVLAVALVLAVLWA